MSAQAEIVQTVPTDRPDVMRVTFRHNWLVMDMDISAPMLTDPVSRQGIVTLAAAILIAEEMGRRAKLIKPYQDQADKVRNSLKSGLPNWSTRGDAHVS